jgi:hypothetical protein
MIEWVEWIEPFGPNNEPVYMRVTIEVAIACAKHNARVLTGLEKPYKTDKDALLDFMSVHWADIKVEEG